VRVEFVNISFDGLYDALYSGKIDLIISALPYDPTLTRDVAYSQSYFNAGLVLLVRRDEEDIEGVQDLEGRIVAVELGSTAHEKARRLKDYDRIGMTILTQRTPEEVISRLLSGEADAVIFDGISARQLIAQGEPLRMVGDLLSDEPYVIATRLDSPELMRQINSMLAILRGEGYLQTLEREWF